MSTPYSAFAHGTVSADSSLQESVIAATQTFRRSSFVLRIGKLFSRMIGTMHDSASDAYAAQHAEDVAALNRMAHNLETSQPALAAELMLLACR